MMAAPKKKSGAGPAVFWYFLLFLTVALVTVLLLEYGDFKAGRHSFLFNKILGFSTAPGPEEINAGLAALAESEQVAYRRQYLEGGPWVFHFTMERSQLKNFKQSLQKTVQGLGARLVSGREQPEETEELIGIFYGGGTGHLLRIKVLPPPPDRTPPEAPAVIEKKRRPAQLRIALVIDDIGYQEGLAAQLHGLGIPLSAAVIPDSPYAESEARLLRQYGLETLIHLPMAARNNQNNYQRGQMVFADSSSAEMGEILARARRRLPHAVGLNNHMGSLITARRDIMERFFEVFRREPLFFVDSRTTADSVAYDLARSMGIPSLYRDVFIDDQVSYENSRQQLQRLILIARQNGRALAIGHPHPSTLKAVRDALPEFEAAGIKPVFASALLEADR